MAEGSGVPVGGHGHQWGPMRPWSKESDPTQGSARWGWGCRLPAPGPQGAQHRIQWLERSLLLQPKALPRHQSELQPLKQLGHNDFHLHLWGRGMEGRKGGGSSEDKVKEGRKEGTRGERGGGKAQMQSLHSCSPVRHAQPPGPSPRTPPSKPQPGPYPAVIS